MDAEYRLFDRLSGSSERMFGRFPNSQILTRDPCEVVNDPVFETLDSGNLKPRHTYSRARTKNITVRNNSIKKISYATSMNRAIESFSYPMCRSVYFLTDWTLLVFHIILQVEV